MDATTPYLKTLMVWWRFGKEHEKEQEIEELRVNNLKTIADHLERKIQRFRAVPEEKWRWWQVSDELIVERWDDDPEHTGSDTRIYYLLKQGVAVIENIHFPPPNEHLKWYIHIADFQFNDLLDCWLMKDLFLDLVIEADDRTYHVCDLPDLARALDVGLIDSDESREILKRLDWVVSSIAGGEFPFPEVEIGRQACSQLGW